MKKIFIVITLIILAITGFAQEYNSIHELHYKEFGIKNKLPGEFDPEGKDIIPLQFDKSKRNNVTIFGYLPDWEYQTARNYLRYDILTHIAAFDFVANASGGLTNPSYWPWTDVINTAHQNGVKVILTVVNFDGDVIHTIMTNSTVKQTFFNNVKSRMIQYQLDGINIDFESLNTADRGDVVNNFMAELSAYVKSTNPEAEISFAGPAVNWSGWKFQGLANACDYIFIMGYSFWGSWSTTTGACAPLTGGSINIANTVNVQYSAVTQSAPEKLILGVPYYGLKWIARTSQPGASVIDWVSSTRFTTDQPNSQTYGLQWNTNNQVPWYRWQINDTSWYQVWFDNDSSLGLKYALAQSKNYRGVGMWALGYDGARQELWNELYRRYYLNVPVELVSFTAVNNSGNVLLNWKTITEVNNFGFEIERISNYKQNEDGNSSNLNWEKIGFVQGFGNSTTPKDYSFVDKNSVSPTLYRLKQIDFDGTFKYSDEIEVLDNAEFSFSLGQNYPNPFNPVTTIKFTIPSTVKGEMSNARINVFDVLGREVVVLVNEAKEPGIYEVQFDASQFTSGVYFYQLKAGNFIETKKMLLVR